MNKAVEGKFPRLHSKTSSALYYIKDVWVETFPSESNKVRTKMEKRKEIARQ
jgi:hypothetical protein